MSLTSFLQNRDVRQRCRQEFVVPTMAVKQEILAPPRSNRYSLIGTAFDYLLRFYLKWLNPDAVTGEWVAELVREALLQDVPELLKTGEHSYVSITELTNKAQWIIEQAKAVFSSRQITDQRIERTLRLAQLDPMFRAGVVDRNLGNVSKEDVEDLRHLISLVEPRLFKASRLCLLNPTFGEASRLVGGADADVVIDDAIIDIKTTKNLRLARDDVNQVIGSFVLHELAGVDGVTPKPAITKVGISFARFGYLHMIDVRSVIHPETWHGFVEWFIARATQEYAAYQLAPADRAPPASRASERQAIGRQ